MRAFWAVYRTIPKLRPRRRGRPSTRGRPRQARFDKRQFLREHRFLLLRRPNHLTRRERKLLRRMVDLAPPLATLRRFVEELHRLFAPDQSLRAARNRRTRLVGQAEYREHPHLAPVIKCLRPEKFEKLIVFLSTEAKERTSNHVERKNRRFRLLQKTRYRRRKPYTITNALKLELMYQKERWLQKQELRLVETASVVAVTLPKAA